MNSQLARIYVRQFKNADDAAKAAVKNIDNVADAAEAAAVAAAKNFTDSFRPLAGLTEKASEGLKTSVETFIKNNPTKSIGDMPLDDIVVFAGRNGMDDLIKANVIGTGLAAGAFKAAKKAPWKSMMLVGAGFGGVLWTIDHLEDVEEDERECIRTCLPRNWDNYYAASTVDGAELPDLDYKTRSDYAAEYKEKTGDELPDDIIFCTDPMVECGAYCQKECEGKYSTIFEKVAENAGRAAGKGAKGLKDASGLGDLFSKAFDGLTNTLITIGIILAIIIGIGAVIYLTKKAKSNGGAQ